MRTRILIFLLLFSFVGCKSARLRKMTATDQVIGLKKGVLLVRLNTAETKAEAMADAGLVEEAGEILAAREAHNDRILEAFATEFEFCPVYFFEADRSGEIRARNYSGVLFDAERQPVPAGKVRGQSILTAEFGRIQPPASNFGLPALVVMDDSLRQLNEPFPFAIRTTLLGDAMEQKAVRILDRYLSEYYGRAKAWKAKQELKGKGWPQLSED